MKKIYVFIIYLLYLTLVASISYASGVNGNAQISGVYEGSPIVIKTTDRLAGAIDSLTWKGKEFVNTNDHGRQIQYAWAIDNQGECNNPTEAGSIADGTGPLSSSILQSLTINAPNQMTTITTPAYWIPPGYVGYPPGGCEYVPPAILSNDLLKKTVTIGSQGLNNVIEFRSEITSSQQTVAFKVEAPTGYHIYDFSNFWTFDPQNNILTNVTPFLKNLPGQPDIKTYITNIPVILSTGDGDYAIGVYAPDIDGFNQGVRVYSLFDALPAYYQNPTTKWSIIYEIGPNNPTTYNFLTYGAIGSLAQVKTTISSLYSQQPATFDSPKGAFDKADCSVFAGWSGNIGRLTDVNNITFYADAEPGKGGTYLGSAISNLSREKAVCYALNGQSECEICPKNAPQCNHGFNFKTPNSLKDGKQHSIYAKATTKYGHMVSLSSSPKQLTCAAIVIGDLDNNNKVDNSDLLILITDFGKTSNFNANADMNKDNKVDLKDLVILAKLI